MSILQRVSTVVIEGKQKEIVPLVEQALAEGLDAKAILDQGLVAGMDVIGERFRSGECFVPEVLVSARAMQAGLNVLKPRLAQMGVKPAGTVVLGTVFGDLHDIGKNIVGIMLEGAGFAVVDLGNNVPVAAFVDAVKKHRPDIVGMSALLTTTMPQMGKVVKALQEAGLRDQVKVMVGGVCVTSEFTAEIGADAHGSNATAATTLAKSFVEAAR